MKPKKTPTQTPAKTWDHVCTCKIILEKVIAIASRIHPATIIFLYRGLSFQAKLAKMIARKNAPAA